MTRRFVAGRHGCRSFHIPDLSSVGPFQEPACLCGGGDVFDDLDWVEDQRRERAADAAAEGLRSDVHRGEGRVPTREAMQTATEGPRSRGSGRQRAAALAQAGLMRRAHFARQYSRLGRTH